MARPPLERIVAAVTGHFGCDAASWAAGRRSADAARAVAAYLARSSFGYSATEVAGALGYRGPSSVSHAVRRIEEGSKTLRSAVRELEARLG